ncbi:MAG: S-layer homology domain-containing protein, partial [Candidatus Peregrinibacteria bacterium]|nr:S-layer homology domain-containing protein [Candidatus Peregrinibacteria bacterium]
DKFPSWATNSIDRVSEAKIMTGYGNGSFQASRLLTRAEAVILVLRTKGIDFDKITIDKGSSFSDVPAGSWFEKAVAEATKQGLISGFPDGTFKPAQHVNRAEWATLISRAFDLKNTSDASEETSSVTKFDDIPSKVWFHNYVLSMENNKLIRQKGRYYVPEKLVSRAEAAWTISEILQKPRLMGTSSENDFSKSRRQWSRRVAIKPRNFNKYKQGYDIEKKEFVVTGIPVKEDYITVTKESDWTDLGSIEVFNNFEVKGTVDLLELRLRFDRTNTGPASSFMLKVTAGTDFSEEFKVGRTGRVFIVGMNLPLQGQESLSFNVQIKPNTSEESFYNKIGTAKVSASAIEGTVTTEYVQEDSRFTYNIKTAPVRFESRDLGVMEFNPIVE